MTVEAYELNGDEPTPERPPEPSLELIDTRSRDDALALAQATYAQFQQAFQWSGHDADALFERIAGSTDSLSDALRHKLLDLYMTSLSSSFVQDETRTNYKAIFELFTRKGYDVTTVRETLSQQQLVESDIDDLYVTKHLLMTISKMSMHQE